MAEETSFFMDLVAGTVGGVAGIIVGQPADTIKVRTQGTINSGPVAIATQLLRREGVAGFFKGITAPIVANAPINATIFVVYGDLIRYFAAQKHAIRTEQLNRQQEKLDREIERTKRMCSSHPENSAAYKAYKTQLLYYTQSSLQLQEVRFRNKTVDRNQKLLLSPMYHFYAGAVAGLMQCVFACPNELVKIKQQTCPTSPGSWATIKQLVRESGVRRGLFQGWWLTCARDVPAFGLYFSSYEIFKSQLNARGWDLSASSFCAGAGAGISSFALLHPFDVLKSNRQMQPFDTPAAQTTTWAIATKGYQEQGARFFLRGITPSVLRAGPVSAVIFLVYEQVMRFMREEGDPGINISIKDKKKQQQNTIMNETAILANSS